jgi:hypothetical protein
MIIAAAHPGDRERRRAKLMLAHVSFAAAAASQPTVLSKLCGIATFTSGDPCIPRRAP